MSHPVSPPSITPNIILAQLITFVPVSIFSPLLAMTASRDPTKMAIKSFGVAAAVAIANIKGCTVGKVDIAPFEILYGSGQSLIITRSLRPSCLRTRDNASNLLSCATMRLTKFESSVLETIKEQVEPTTVAEATIGQLYWSQPKMSKDTLNHWVGDSRSTSPPWKAVHKSSQGQACGVPYNRRESGSKAHEPQDQPSPFQVFPFLRNWFQPCEYPLTKDQEQYRQDYGDDADNSRGSKLHWSHLLDGFEDLPPCSFNVVDCSIYQTCSPPLASISG